MKKHLTTSILYTAITAILLGILYPLAVTGIAHLLFPRQANGGLITRNGQLIGSSLIGQSFTGPGYFHSRPSAAGTGYDATSSSGSNLASTSKALITRVDASVASEKPDASVVSEQTTTPVPVDLVTASASGLDPDITPAAALYQVARVAQQRHLPAPAVEDLVRRHTTPRQFGLLGEPRVNVLELNLALDALSGPTALSHPTTQP
jgi:K+-transporting ATPase ATPase C chain